MGLAEIVIAQWSRVSGYFSGLVHTFVSPKRTIGKLSGRDDKDFADALLFLVLSTTLQIIAGLPLTPEKRVSVPALFGFGVLTIVGTIPFAGGIHIAWKLVGSRATFLRSFIITAYLGSVAMWIIVIGALVELTIILVVDFSVFDILMRAVESGASLPVRSLSMRQLHLLVTASAVFWLFALGTFVWFIIGWGAYREASGLSRVRSMGAFAIALAFEIPILGVIIIVAYGLSLYVWHVP
jgi:hypothetical protein